ncbi:GntR family transcriptional regulator [Vreelandella glaciei]|uniref:GntR family transcriptional regulator n=1 Tax=Vreelandella glaciei TaxID=186761 RepID=UPI0030ECA54E|tara:strand:+ start:8491 stop:9147 length:657 start_codon:yes stop_codon:yes gene_type:complete
MSKDTKEGTTAASEAFYKLKKDLIGGKFPSGEKITITTLKDTYDVGLSPLREALSRLAAHGLLEQINQRGFRVPEVSLCQLKDITKLRIEIEEMALQRSFDQADIHWEANLIAVYHKLKSLDRDSLYMSELWEDIHVQFHKSLLSSCSSPWLIKFVDQLHDQFDRYRRFAPVDEGVRKKLNEHHEQLLNMALERDISSALLLNKEHIMLSYRTIRRVF